MIRPLCARHVPATCRCGPLPARWAREPKAWCFVCAMPATIGCVCAARQETPDAPPRPWALTEDGAYLVVAGNAPAVLRVLGVQGLTGWRYAEPDGTEHLSGAGLWPEVVPRVLLGYKEALVVPVASLPPVDLLRVVCGAYARRNAAEAYCLWQPASDRALVRLTEREARAALASPWLRAARGDADPAATRSVTLREEVRRT